MPCQPTLERLEIEHLPEFPAALSLLQVLAGELWLRPRGGGLVRLSRGDLVCSRADEAVRLDRGRSHGEVFLFHAPRDWVSRALALAPGDASVLGSSIGFERAHADVARRAARCLLEAELASRTPRGPERMVHAARCLELVSLCLESGPIDRAPRPVATGAARQRSPLVRALKELREAPIDECTLPSLALRLGLSERQVSRLIRQELGISFRDFTASLRLERAKRLLTTSDVSLTDVALESGWRSPSHMSHVFRKRVGMTPSAYRDSVDRGRAPLRRAESGSS